MKNNRTMNFFKPYTKNFKLLNINHLIKYKHMKHPRLNKDTQGNDYKGTSIN